MIRVIVIDGPSKKLYELEMQPSHVAMEEEIGTRFWVARRLNKFRHNCIFFHAESSVKGYEDYSFLGVAYMGSGLVCSIDAYGDLGSTNLSLDEVRRNVTFVELSDVKG